MFNRQFNIHKDFQDLNYLENEIFPKIRNAEFETVEDKKQVMDYVRQIFSNQWLKSKKGGRMKTYKIVVHNPRQVDMNDNILDDKSNVIEEYKDFKSRSEAKQWILDYVEIIEMI